MKFLYAYILILLPCIVRGQGRTLPAQAKELATYIPTASRITGMQYQLPYNAHSYHLDSAKKELLVIFLLHHKERPTSAPYEIMLFDLEKNTVKWRLHSKTSNVYMTTAYVLTSMNGSTKCYRRADGKQMWSKSDANVKYIDEQKGIILTDYVRGLNIHTGKTIWQRYKTGLRNWEDIEIVNDSSIILAAGGIYSINLYTGKGWSANDITTKDEFEPADAIGIIPTAPHYPAVPVSVTTNTPAIWRTTTSGILVNDNIMYIATRKRVMSIDKSSGKLLWQTLLPDSTGITSLYLQDDKLVLLNEGKVAYSSGIEKRYGSPYIVVLDKNTGIPGKSYAVPTIGHINETKFYDGRIMMLSLNAINIFDIPTNRMYSFGTAGENYHVLQDDVHYMNDEGGNRKITAGDCCYIYNSEQNVIHIDKNFFSITNVEKGKVSSVDEYGRIQLFYDGDNNVYRDGKHLVQTPATNKGFIVNEHLYIVDKNTLSVIPLSETR